MSSHLVRSPLASSLSFHALRNARVAARIVAHSGLAPPQLVLEPGAGGGVLTAELARVARKVIAIETDRGRWDVLRGRARDFPNIQPVLGDFLEFPLPPAQPYQVVANLPFSLTSAVLRKMTLAPNPPRLAALVVQREAALHWSGLGRESVASVLAKVEFAIDVPLALRRTDFAPFPSVESVLLRFRRRDVPAVARAEQGAFRHFAWAGFAGGSRSVASNLRGFARTPLARRELERLGIAPDAAPGEVPFAAWLALFERFGAGGSPALGRERQHRGTGAPSARPPHLPGWRRSAR